jgi:hypothetical protein
VLLAAVPHAVAHLVVAAGDGDAVAAADEDVDPVAEDAEGAEAGSAAVVVVDEEVIDDDAPDVSGLPQAGRATATVAVSAATRTPRLTMLRGTPMVGSFDGPRDPRTSHRVRRLTPAPGSGAWRCGGADARR